MASHNIVQMHMQSWQAFPKDKQVNLNQSKQQKSNKFVGQQPSNPKNPVVNRQTGSVLFSNESPVEVIQLQRDRGMTTFAPMRAQDEAVQNSQVQYLPGLSDTTIQQSGPALFPQSFSADWMLGRQASAALNQNQNEATVRASSSTSDLVLLKYSDDRPRVQPQEIAEDYADVEFMPVNGHRRAAGYQNMQYAYAFRLME